MALRSGERIARVPGVAIVYTNTYTGIPAAFVNLLRNMPALHQTVVFITVRWGLGSPLPWLCSEVDVGSHHY